jgi:hypothetical protein
VFVTTSMAAILAITAGSYVVLREQGHSADPLAAAAADLPAGPAAAALEQERQHMIRLDAAAKTMTIVSSPKLAAQPAAAPTVAAGDTGTSSDTGTTDPVTTVPPPDPGTAQSIAEALLPSYGWSSSEFSCLDELWERESGWSTTAENASGAYGIPQALPGSKMASAGADWETDATTQIKWGLGYIQDVYGSPCGAWDHEEADGWY